MKNLTLLVNGSEVPLNDFAKRIIINILAALLSSLTLKDAPREAVFRISDSADS